ncbi:MAG TPA: hemolysin family protein [Chitinophagaceae bacterium]|nr:hemolysin family protein [Chitinophagaceae bacterium]
MEIFIILLLILLNGIFSMAEIALVSARKARLEAQANKGSEPAREALNLSNKPDTFLSTVQIGITLIGILLGIVSGERLQEGLANWLRQFDLVSKYASGIATTILVIIITYFSLVFGELLPKRIGLTYPEQVAKLMARPMRWISWITHPFILLLTKSTQLITNLFNIKSNDNQVTEEEIKAMISEGTEHGTIEEAEQEIIERVFHLGDRTITSLMTHRSDIVAFDVNDNEEQVREKINKEPHSVYPICEGGLDNLKGVVSIKDLYVANDLTKFKELMKPPLFVPDNVSAYTVLEKFKESKIHCCYIVDEYGSLQGMITLNDILEAIVGDMPEQHAEDYSVVKREDGTFLVDAQIPFYDFLAYFEQTEFMNEGDQDFNTLAGFILHELEHIPQTGETLDWKGFRFEIIDMDAQRIDKVLVQISKDIKEEMEEE